MLHERLPMFVHSHVPKRSTSGVLEAESPLDENNSAAVSGDDAPRGDAPLRYLAELPLRRLKGRTQATALRFQGAKCTLLTSQCLLDAVRRNRREHRDLYSPRGPFCSAPVAPAVFSPVDTGMGTYHFNQ
jgi:hypothetical protein